MTHVKREGVQKLRQEAPIPDTMIKEEEKEKRRDAKEQMSSIHDYSSLGWRQVAPVSCHQRITMMAHGDESGNGSSAELTKTGNWFTTKTDDEQTSTDKTTGQKEEQTESLSPGAQRGLSSAAGAATNMILQYAWDGEKPEANDWAQAAVGAGEAFFLGHAINAVSEGNVLAGGGVALAASCASAVARVLLKNQDEKNKEANNGEHSEDPNAPKRDHLEKATEVVFSLVNSGVKFLALPRCISRRWHGGLGLWNCPCYFMLWDSRACRSNGCYCWRSSFLCYWSFHRCQDRPSVQGKYRKGET